jgi:hypothetical protein
MANDDWIEFNGTELVNLSRTVQLAEVMGIDTVWVNPESVAWIEDALGGTNYDDVTTAPWYDPGFPASAEFAGVMVLSLPGLDDSTRQSSPTEYIGDGGNSGKARSAMLPLVANVVLVARTERGAKYGKRWMDRVLRGSASRTFCVGSDLRYFDYADADAPQVHRRDVSLTRASSVTRKRVTDCSATWMVTFTWTAADPYEYGDPITVVEDLGAETPTGPSIIDEGSLPLVEMGCPAYDYTPIYDPLYPALVPPPTAPDFYPAGWNIFPGMTFDRRWVEVSPPEPTTLNVVPVITLTSPETARMVRVSIWSEATGPYEQCEPLFAAVVSYLPPDVEFTIDGERQASYVWDGLSPVVRRSDSLVYSPDATPVEWTSFNDDTSLFITLDVFADSSGYEGDGEVRVKVDLIQKSD